LISCPHLLDRAIPVAPWSWSYEAQMRVKLTLVVFNECVSTPRHVFNDALKKTQQFQVAKKELIAHEGS